MPEISAAEWLIVLLAVLARSCLAGIVVAAVGALAVALLHVLMSARANDRMDANR